MGAYEIRVITNGMTSEGQIVELVTADGVVVKLGPESVRFQASGDGVTTLSLSFYGCECRVIHTPGIVKEPTK